MIVLENSVEDWLILHMCPGTHTQISSVNREDTMQMACCQHSNRWLKKNLMANKMS